MPVRSFAEVALLGLPDNQTNLTLENEKITVIVNADADIIVLTNGVRELAQIHAKSLQLCRLNQRVVALRPASTVEHTYVLSFASPADLADFQDLVDGLILKAAEEKSAFDDRTDESSASQYFQFYGYLSQQQNMMQDYIRTATYQRAMLANVSDFKDKIVLDVGAGSGILSFFAIQSGAKKVYAVEASSIAQHCETLVKHNGLENRIHVIAGKIEEITVPEKVDTIISEPMGYMLVNERMLETYLHAKKFLKPGGKVYPSRGDLHMAPFSDEALYLEQCSKANFWCQEFFYGVNLAVLREQAVREYFRQPVVDTFDIRLCVAKPQTYSIDFAEASEQDLHRIEIPLCFQLLQSSLIHGLAFWFDVAFIGSNQTVWLSTSPTEPLTHWYQVRCLLHKPIMGKQGQICTGKLTLRANKRQSYDVDLQLACDGDTSENQLDLKNPYFRYTGQMVQPPAGQNSTSPTEAYWSNIAGTGDASAGMNGFVNGLSNPSMINGLIGPADYNVVPQQQSAAQVSPASAAFHANIMNLCKESNLYNQPQQPYAVSKQQAQSQPIAYGNVLGAQSPHLLPAVGQNVVVGSAGGDQAALLLSQGICSPQPQPPPQLFSAGPLNSNAHVASMLMQQQPQHRL